MSNFQNFGESNKSSKTKESFNYRNEENVNPRADENFVFHFEENKITNTTSNQLGKEYNNESHIRPNEVVTNRQEDYEELSSATSTASTTTSTSTATSSAASATSSVSAAVETVAVAATTAVVVVVGGGLVLYGQTVEKPAIVQFEELYAFENTIHFSIALGNDMEKLSSGQEDTECDIVIELTCDTYVGFHESREVKSYGIYEYDFSDLDYSTDYTIGVYQMAFLDLEKERLIEPIHITTEAKPEEDPEDPEDPPVEDPTGSFTIDVQEAPFGGLTFYMSIDYTGDTTHLSDFAVKYAEGTYLDDEEIDWVGECHLPDNELSSRQKVDLDIPELAGTYTFALFATDNTPQGRYAFNEDVVDTSKMLFKQEIAMEDIKVEPENTTAIYIRRTNGQYKNTYDMYANYATVSEYYSDFAVTMSTLSGETVVVVEFTEGLGTIQGFVWDVEMFSETDVYTFVLTCTNTDPNVMMEGDGTTGADGITGYVLYSEDIDLSTIEEEYVEPEKPEEPPEVIEPTFNGLSFDLKQSHFDTSVVGLSMSIDDEEGYWSDFHIKLSDPDNGDEYESDIEPYQYGGYYLSNPDVTIEGVLGHSFYYELTCTSTASGEEKPHTIVENSELVEFLDDPRYIPGCVYFETVAKQDTTQPGYYSDYDLVATIESPSSLGDFDGLRLMFTQREGEPIYETISDPYAEVGTVLEDFIHYNQSWTVSTQTLTNNTWTTVFSEEIDFADFESNEPTEHEEPVEPSVFNDVEFTFMSSHFDTRWIYVELDYDDPNEYWHDFFVEFTSTDGEKEFLDCSIMEDDQGRNFVAGMMNYQRMYGYYYNYVIKCYSDDPELENNDEPIELFNSLEEEKDPINLDGLEPADLIPEGGSYYPGCVYFDIVEREPTGQSGTYSDYDMVAYVENPLDLPEHDYIRLAFTNSEGNTIYDMVSDSADGTILENFVDDNEIWTVSTEISSDEENWTEVFSESINFDGVEGNEQIYHEPTTPTIEGTTGFMIYGSYQSDDEYLVVDFQLHNDGISWDITQLQFEFTSTSATAGTQTFTGTVHALTNGSGKKYLEFEDASYIQNLKRLSYDYVITYNGQQVEGEHSTGTTNPNDITNEYFNGAINLLRHEVQEASYNATRYTMTVNFDESGIELYDYVVVTFEYTDPTNGETDFVEVTVSQDNYESGVDVTDYFWAKDIDISECDLEFDVSVNGHLAGNETEDPEFIFSEHITQLRWDEV